MVVYDITEAVLWFADCGRPHHKVVGEQFFEEVDSAGVEVVVAPHLDELGSRVNAHLLVPVTFHDNLLGPVAQLVEEHGFDDTVVHEYCRVLSTLLVVLGYARVVRSELRLRALRSKEHAVQGWE